MYVKRRALLALLCIVLFVVLIHLNQRQDSGNTSSVFFIDRVLITVYSPILKSIQKVRDSISGVWTGYFNLVGAKKENRILKEELDLKNLTILSLKERLKIRDHEEMTLQKLKGLNLNGVSARVISFDPFARSQTIWISVGEKDGVSMDQPVITFQGLVGRIIKVLPQTAQVLLLVDSHFAVDVLNEETRVRALVVGSGGGTELNRYPLLSHMEYLKLGDEIRPGDLFFTSGLSNLYPIGIPVGNVIRVERGANDLVENSTLLPVVDFTKLENVVVLVK